MDAYTLCITTTPTRSNEMHSNRQKRGFIGGITRRTKRYQSTQPLSEGSSRIPRCCSCGRISLSRKRSLSVSLVESKTTILLFR